MTKHITLPPVASDILAGHRSAATISESIIVAYWMHGRWDSTALYHLRLAHEAFAVLADALGYTITPKVTPETLRAEHATICEAMNRGTWPGSAAEALAEIEHIMAEIAELEEKQ